MFLGSITMTPHRPPVHLLPLLCSIGAAAAASARTNQRRAAEAFTIAASHSNAAACPCADASLCQPIAGPPARKREIFGFVGGNGSQIDLTRITTIAWASDPKLMCAAHKAGARVVLAAPGPEKVFGANATVRQAWVAAAVQAVVRSHADGLTFDWESPCAVGCPEQKAYVALIGATRRALRALSESYQVSVCVAWSPDDIDGRAYDVVAFAANADLLYVMDYDTRSQIFDACVAAADAPFAGMVRGVSRYLHLGIPPTQLVLGVPWYGYRYPCLPGTPPADRFCPLKQVPFRGVNCSDAAGREVGYATIVQRLSLSRGGRQWDTNQLAPYFNTVEPDANGTMGTVQYWYDDPESLRRKYAQARLMGLRGVGPYTFVDVPKGDTAMWAALDAFL